LIAIIERERERERQVTLVTDSPNASDPSLIYAKDIMSMITKQQANNDKRHMAVIALNGGATRAGGQVPGETVGYVGAACIHLQSESTSGGYRVASPRAVDAEN